MKNLNTYTRLATLLCGLALEHVTAGSAAAQTLPFSKCQTITQPGSYQLIRNLTTDGDCLVVAADFVTIDLNGFTITGDGSGLDSGIRNDGTRKGIALHNGTITNFALAGIKFRATGDPVVDAASSVLIENMRIIGNNVGLSAGADVIVRNSVVSGSLGDGINLGPGAVVTGTIASGNGASGITGALTGATIIGNTADGNGTVGIFVNAFGGATLVNNTAMSNGVAGISVICPSNLIGNTATDNATNLILNGSGCNTVNNLAP